MVNITERANGETTILDLEGNLIMGGGSKKFGQEIRRLVAAGKTNILLDFTGVKYIDSSGIGELVSGAEAINSAGGSLKLSNLSAKVEDVISLSGVRSLFEIDDQTESE
jgi:anti-sigma B factor antagonist